MSLLLMQIHSIKCTYLLFIANSKIVLYPERLQMQKQVSQTPNIVIDKQSSILWKYLIITRERLIILITYLQGYKSCESNLLKNICTGMKNGSRFYSVMKYILIKAINTLRMLFDVQKRYMIRHVSKKIKHLSILSIFKSAITAGLWQNETIRAV